MFEIEPEFLAFLELLEKKEEGVPLAYYQESIDFLTALFGDGDCRDHMVGGIIITGTDVLIKMYPKKNESRFAGIKVWGGIQGFLSRYYREKYAARYGEFVCRHNAAGIKIPVREIISLLSERLEVTKRYAEYRTDMERFFNEQNPVVHIPLILPEKLAQVH